MDLWSQTQYCSATVKFLWRGRFSLTDLELQSDGKILVAGDTASSHTRATLLRLLEDGTIDTTFNFRDETIPNQSNTHTSNTEIALQGEKLLVTQFATVVGENNSYLRRWRLEEIRHAAINGYGFCIGLPSVSARLRSVN